MMTFDDFRSEMKTYRQTVSERAIRSKESNRALSDLGDLYRRFDTDERKMADQVLIEWVSSDDEGIRFDAESLIREFQIASAIPALEELIGRLSRASSPGAPYELDKVRKILAGLQ
jgi:hypothetical protein